MNKQLSALTFAGIRPDSLGEYLSGLGLLAAAAQRWPVVRGCWKDGQFVLLSDEIGIEAVEHYLLKEWTPTCYERWWEKEYDEDRSSAKKKKPVVAIAKRRACQPNDQLRSLDATLVTLNRPMSNPLFGNLAGRVGAKRDFSRAQKSCLQFVKAARGDEISLDDTGIPNDLKSVLKGFAKRADKLQIASEWLRHTLKSTSCSEIPPIGSAGTWFTFANKTFNSGQNWAREAQISPWSFLLALEGALLLVGGVARRLSANAKPYAVFPFVADAPSPLGEGEIGLAKSEFWAPLWAHPATLSEVRALLERGLARIGQRAAKAPHEFAVAVRAAGVDAGVAEFARFTLRQTTSGQYYEAIPGEHVQVGSPNSTDSQLIQETIDWLDRLPYEKQRGKFSGLRGPLEQAIIRIAERADDAERWQHLLLLLAETQGRIDRNKSLRDRCRALGWLAEGWFAAAWPSPPPEIQLARAVASLGAGGEMPLAVNIFGIELSKVRMLNKVRTPIFSGDKRPQRAIWHHGDLLRLLADVLERRLVDTDAAQPLPLDAPARCPLAAVEAFLADSLDFELIGRWIPPLSLIKWTQLPAAVATLSAKQTHATDSTMLLHSLFRPLFYPNKLEVGGEKLFPDHLRPSAALARRLLNLIRQGELAEAVQLAQNRYLAAGRAIVLPPVDLSAAHERIAAALIIPMRHSDVVSSLARWLQPSKHNLKGGER
jgi:CRISPR-associated protein Csx17